nr:hypothetical protein [Sphingobacterium sp. CFCC 11742]
MKISTISMQLSFGHIWTSSAEDFPANRSVKPDGVGARKMTDTSSQRLSELLSKHDRIGLFLKMLLDCSPFWTRTVFLKWKSKRLSFFVQTTIKKQVQQLSVCNEELLDKLFLNLDQQDMYFRHLKTARQSFCVFQLLPSMHHTEGTGSGLLPTPNTIQIERITINPQTIQTVEQTMKDGTPRQRSIKDALIVMAAENGLIAAVTTKGSNTATARMISTQVHDGSIHNVTPKRLIALLPPLMESGVMKLKNHQQINTDTIKFLIGMTGQLNPRFLAEMMGFPKYWTELPFLRGVPTV